MKSSPAIWHYVVIVKPTVMILSIFVAFLENTNFTIWIPSGCPENSHTMVRWKIFPTANLSTNDSTFQECCDWLQSQ